MGTETRRVEKYPGALNGDILNPACQQNKLWPRKEKGGAYAGIRRYRSSFQYFIDNLAKFNPWPNNAWIGCTITGAETPERQQEMMQALGQVEAIIKWVSYEPMLGPLAVSLNNIQWLVVGADSTRGAREPKPEWLKGIQYITCPQWYKNNLPDSWWTEPRRQEVPR